MNYYSAVRDVEDIKKQFQSVYGKNAVNTERYDKFGSDYVTALCYVNEENIKPKDRFGYVIINTFNGFFIVTDGKNNRITTSDDCEYDGKKWFDDLCNMIYVRYEEAESLKMG